MGHRKWKENKLQPGTAGPGNMLGCCLISVHPEHEHCKQTGMDPIERLRFLAPAPGTGAREGGEKTQPSKASLPTALQ